MEPAPPREPPPVCATEGCSDQGKPMKRAGIVQNDKGRPFQQYECPSCQQKTTRAAD